MSVVRALVPLKDGDGCVTGWAVRVDTGVPAGTVDLTALTTALNALRTAVEANTLAVAALDVSIKAATPPPAP